MLAIDYTIATCMHKLSNIAMEDLLPSLQRRESSVSLLAIIDLLLVRPSDQISSAQVLGGVEGVPLSMLGKLRAHPH